MMSLYLNVLPLSISEDFLTLFFEQGWDFFYKFTLVIFDFIEEQLMKTEDEMDVIWILKDIYNCHFDNFKYSKSPGGSPEKLRDEPNWAHLLLKAERLHLP